MQSTKGSTTASSKTTSAFASPITAGNLIVVLIGEQGTASAADDATAVTDTAGNTYTKAVAQWANTGMDIEIWYCANIKGGSNVTITVTNNAGRTYVAAQEFSGVATSNPLDQTHVTVDGSGTALNSGATAATTQASELVVVGTSFNGKSFTLGSGYSNLNQLRDTTNHYAVAQESKVVSATGAQTATFTLSATDTWACAVATFKAAGTTQNLSAAASDSSTATDTARPAVLRSRASADTAYANDSVSRSPAPVCAKIRDVTGPGQTDTWQIGGTDLGVTAQAPNGQLVSVFGDTFLEASATGTTDWRSPVALFGNGANLDSGIVWTGAAAAGATSTHADQIIPYTHNAAYGGYANVSTMIPSDIINLGGTLYLQVAAMNGYPTVAYTAVYQSTDNGATWSAVPNMQWDGANRGGYFQFVTWQQGTDGYVYMYATGEQRNKGIILLRAPVSTFTDPTTWQDWFWDGSAWGWTSTVPTNPSVVLGGSFGENSLRLIGNQWVWTCFDNGNYRIDMRLLPNGPTSDLTVLTPTTLCTGVAWSAEDHSTGKVAQLYGGFIVPGSTLNPLDLHLVVSQWNTSTNWPYKAMQFRYGIVTTEVLPRNVADTAAATDSATATTGLRPPTLVQTTQGPPNASATTTQAFPQPVSTGNLIVVTVGDSGTSSTAQMPSAVTDSAGNTYTQVVRRYANTALDLSVWYCANARGGNNVTVSATIPAGGASLCYIVAQEFSGIATSNALDVTHDTVDGSGTAPSSGATTTTSQATELVVGSTRVLIGTGNNPGTVTFTAGSGYSGLASLSHIAGANGVAQESTVVTATGTQNAAFTINPSAN